MKKIFSTFLIALLSVMTFADTYTVAGGNKTILGSTWSTDESAGNDMTVIGETNFYKLEKNFTALTGETKLEYKVVKNRTSWPDGANWEVTLPEGATSMTFFYNASNGSYNAFSPLVVVGVTTITQGENWNNAATKNLLTTTDGYTYTLLVEDAVLEANVDYAYKVVEFGSWIVYWDNGSGNNATFSVEEDGKYQIEYAYNAIAKTFTVTPTQTGGAVINHTYSVASETALLGVYWDPTVAENQMEEQLDGTYQLVKEGLWLDARSYEYKICADGDWTITYPSGSNNASLVIAEAGKYDVTFTLDLSQEGNEYSATAELKEKAKFYIAGIGGWSSTQVRAITDSYTFSDLAAGEYQLKVLPTGSWDDNNSKGYDDLTAKHNGLYKDNDGNVCFQLTAAADVTVTYVDGETFTVTSETPAAFKTHTLKLVPRKWATDGHKFAAWVWQRNGDLVIRQEFTDFFAGAGDTLTVETSLGLDSVQYVCLASSVAEPNWNKGSVLCGAQDTISYNAGKAFTMIRDWEGTYEAVEAGDFYLIGSENLVGAGGWSNIAFPVTGTSYKFENLAAGQDYYLKVYDWGTYWGYDDLNNKSNAGIRTDEARNIIFRLKTAGDVTVNYDPTNSIFTVAGNFTQVPVGILFDGAEDAIYFNIASDNKTASLAMISSGDDYRFKVIIDGDTLSKANEGEDFGIWRSYNHVEAPFTKDLTEQLVLHAPMPGTYTFTYTYADDQFVVTYPELPDPVYYIYGDFSDWKNVEANKMTLKDGVYTVDITFEANTAYEFKVNQFQYEESVTYGDANYSNAMTYLNCSDWTLVSPGYNINLLTRFAGKYQFQFTLDTKNLDVVFPDEDIPTGVDNTEATVKAVKVLRDGQLLIIKGDKTYNVVGQIR